MGPSVADDGFINTFKTEMNMCGEIAVMRRTQEGKVCITFKEGFGALAAFKYHGKEVRLPSYLVTYNGVLCTSFRGKKFGSVPF